MVDLSAVLIEYLTFKYRVKLRCEVNLPPHTLIAFKRRYQIELRKRLDKELNWKIFYKSGQKLPQIVGNLTQIEAVIINLVGITNPESN